MMLPPLPLLGRAREPGDEPAEQAATAASAVALKQIAIRGQDNEAKDIGYLGVLQRGHARPRGWDETPTDIRTAALLRSIPV